MKALLMTGPGGPGVVGFAEVEQPRPATGQLSIAVEYAGLNFADALARRGLAGYSTGWPFVPGLEVGGTVLEVGPDAVGGFVPGDRVVAFTVNGGGLAEVAVAEAALTARVPHGMSLESATTIPLTWASALGLVRVAHVGRNDNVLVTSAGGGVGAALAAILPRHDVAVIVGGTRSDVRLAPGYLGVQRDGDFLETALKLTGGRGFDVVLESVGGEILDAMPQLLASGGRLVTYGAAAGQPDSGPRSFGELRVNNWTVAGFSISSWARSDPAKVQALISGVIALAEKEENGLAVPAPTVVPWSEARAAHVAQADGKAIGKTVVAVRERPAHPAAEKTAG